MKDQEGIELDKVDKGILKELLKDSRKSYQEIGDILKISAGTVHVRLTKLKEAGIVTGSKININYQKLGLDVCCFIGLNLRSAKDMNLVLKNLNYFDEVVEVHYTTGQYSLFIKVMTRNTRELHSFLVEKLQRIEEISSTETFVSLNQPLHRDPVV